MKKAFINFIVFGLFIAEAGYILSGVDAIPLIWIALCTAMGLMFNVYLKKKYEDIEVDIVLENNEESDDEDDEYSELDDLDDLEDGYSTEDSEDNTPVIKSVKDKLITAMVYLLVISFTILMTIGLCTFSREVLCEALKGLLNTTKGVRYSLYGVVYPLSYTYLTTWLFTDERPITIDNVKTFCILMALSMFAGLLICVKWVTYSQIMMAL